MISEKNEDAYSIMIDKYQPLISKYAEQYYQKYDNRGIEKEELIQEGILGLINATISVIMSKLLFMTITMKCYYIISNMSYHHYNLKSMNCD